MVDVLTPEQRKMCMSGIRSRDTKPEMIVRRMVHGMGFRFRLHYSMLPGRPDLVLPRHRKVIFVHGCFWHMHKCKYGKVKPATNPEFWEEKRKRTVKRDRNVGKQIRERGWETLIVWECEVKDTEKLEESLRSFLISHADKG